MLPARFLQHADIGRVDCQAVVELKNEAAEAYGTVTFVEMKYYNTIFN